MPRKTARPLSPEAARTEAARFGLLARKLAGHIGSGCLTKVAIQWTAGGKMDVLTTAAPGRDIREVIAVTPYGYEIRDPDVAPPPMTTVTPEEVGRPSPTEPATDFQLTETADAPKRRTVRRKR